MPCVESDFAYPTLKALCSPKKICSYTSKAWHALFCVRLVTSNHQICLQSVGVEAGVTVAAFAVRLAHVHAKQHHWTDADSHLARASSALEALSASGPSQAAALLRADLERVRGDVMRLQGAPEQALEQYQAAAVHALQALEAADCSESAERRGAQRKGGARQGRGRTAKSRSRSQKDESAGLCDCRWPLTALLARVRVQQAACHAAMGDISAAESHLDAACEACASIEPVPSEAFPLQTAAAAYQRAVLLERGRAAPAAQDTCVWGSQAAGGVAGDAGQAAAERVSRKGRGRKGAAAAKQARAAAELPGLEENALQQLRLLLEAYLLSRHVPGLSRSFTAPTLATNYTI